MPLHTPTVTLMHSVCVIGKVLNYCILGALHHSTFMYAGILCGECRDGKGVSILLNDCVSCYNAQGLLILGLSKFNKGACMQHCVL